MHHGELKVPKSDWQKPSRSQRPKRGTCRQRSELPEHRQAGCKSGLKSREIRYLLLTPQHDCLIQNTSDSLGSSSDAPSRCCSFPSWDAAAALHTRRDGSQGPLTAPRSQPAPQNTLPRAGTSSHNQDPCPGRMGFPLGYRKLSSFGSGGCKRRVV